jgi:hypothetical protein
MTKRTGRCPDKYGHTGAENFFQGVQKMPTCHDKTGQTEGADQARTGHTSPLRGWKDLGLVIIFTGAEAGAKRDMSELPEQSRSTM